MKSAIFCLLAFLLASNLMAQKRWEYCEIINNMDQGFTSKTSIEVINGDTEKKWGKQVQFLTDSTGSKIKFANYVDALNYLGKDGWEVILSYINILPGDVRQIHLLLKRSYE